MVLIKTPLVTASWLNQNLIEPNIVVLDASINKVADKSQKHESKQIPNTLFFNIKHRFSDVSAPFPNTVPSKTHFNKEAQTLGINNDSAVVVYDDKGIYSSARAWYLFKAFGFNNVAVLDGGLPEWKKAGFQVEAKSSSNVMLKGDFEGKYNSNYFKFFDDIQNLSNNSGCQILDARSNERFTGSVPEPRAGLRSGIIPNSINLPFKSLMNGNCMKSREDLTVIFKRLSHSEKKLVFTCGSGITACILALAAEIVGLQDISVYDGSWTEYGTLIKN